MCEICANHATLVYYRVDEYRHLLKPNGSIPPRNKTRLCRRHQSDLAVATKRAREMALLPPAPPPPRVNVKGVTTEKPWKKTRQYKA